MPAESVLVVLSYRQNGALDDLHFEHAVLRVRHLLHLPPGERTKTPSHHRRSRNWRADHRESFFPTQRPGPRSQNQILRWLRQTGHARSGSAYTSRQESTAEEQLALAPLRLRQWPRPTCETGLDEAAC